MACGPSPSTFRDVVYRQRVRTVNVLPHLPRLQPAQVDRHVANALVQQYRDLPHALFLVLIALIKLRRQILYCDCSKYAGPPLGTPCNSNYGCASGYCDAGPNTRQTNRCMPRGNTGKRGDLCTANNQCSNVIPLQCIGLHLDGNNWVPGQCK